MVLRDAPDILKKIVEVERKKVERLKAERPLSKLQERIDGQAVCLEVGAQSARAGALGNSANRLRLQQRLAPGQTDEAAARGRQDSECVIDLVGRQRIRECAKASTSRRLLDATTLRRSPRPGRVTPCATQIAATEAHEDGLRTDPGPLALCRGEDFDQVCVGAARRPVHQASSVDRPIAISDTISSRRSGCVSTPLRRRRDTWSSSARTVT